jgi:predicted kinase
VIVIALAGLPGTGKSTLARALAPVLGAPILDKDEVRAALFEPHEIDYSAEQDETCMRAIHERVVEWADRAHEVGREPSAAPASVILDGRTYSRREQVQALAALAARIAAPLLLVECICSEAVALQRLARDAAAGGHPAANRGPELYRRLRASADPLPEPKLVIDTDRTPLPEQVDRVRAALAAWNADND